MKIGDFLFLKYWTLQTCFIQFAVFFVVSFVFVSVIYCLTLVSMVEKNRQTSNDIHQRHAYRKNNGRCASFFFVLVVVAVVVDTCTVAGKGTSRFFLKFMFYVGVVLMVVT